jgi:hypothetical protein|tara:strand:+ start:6397 stop:6855 length:459 start_codon:yes stop_codon:yes gene_type:complete
MIRLLKEEDIDSSVEFMSECYDIMKYKKGTSRFNPETVKKTVSMLMESGLGLFLGYFEDNKLNGLFGASITPSIMDDTFIQADELLWHAHPSLKAKKRVKIMIELLNSFEETLKQTRRIDAIHIIFSNQRLIPFLKKRGYSELQYHCIKEIL